MMHTKTMIYIVRHGETDWNKDEKMMGITDVPLNKRGKKQVESIARHLQHIPIDVIYSSPLSRTVKTASAINKYHHLPIITDDALREREFGALEGKSYLEVQALGAPMIFSETWNYVHYHPPGGESLHDIHTRVLRFVTQMLRTNKGKSILLVSHGVTIRILAAILLGTTTKLFNAVRVQNASLIVIERRGKEAILHTANYLTKE